MYSGVTCIIVKKEDLISASFLPRSPRTYRPVPFLHLARPHTWLGSTNVQWTSIQWTFPSFSILWFGRSCYWRMDLTPDLSPQSCFDPHMDIRKLDLFFDLWTLESEGNKPQKGLQIIIALHFSVLCQWSLGMSVIQIWNNNVLSQNITWIRVVVDSDSPRHVSRLSSTWVILMWTDICFIFRKLWRIERRRIPLNPRRHPSLPSACYVSWNQRMIWSEFLRAYVICMGSLELMPIGMGFPSDWHGFRMTYFMPFGMG